MTHHDLTAAANHVLHHLGYGGYPAGDFTTRLLAAWDYADHTSAARLANAYPAYGHAIGLINQPGGIRQLRALATSAFPHRGGHNNPCAYAAGIGPNCTCPTTS